ncbi:conserved hypothetical protein [Candidatus Koribacter versatilis Ellin345]|uniref:DUF4239 domain-containing protein n=1 Tax=Koribacter versatilis (strain Ellin345) TaxID=204669 RepID=Q1INR4_KORVE|nr:hypothetical protein [Candidatus Koribacter versatilis]ABF41486.1 conserved hypothetical protein [Candidatus Koribacter versatilis Ellin345]
MIIFHYPRVLLVVSFLILAGAAALGDFFRTRLKSISDDQRSDLSLVLGASLTLLGLLIGFSFSMAINRYDQRKNYEEAEANAIGTEYLRADLLPPQAAAQVKDLLRLYLDQRILFYSTRDYVMSDAPGVEEIERKTAKLQGQLWEAVRPAAAAQPSPLTALAVAGMNDVLNSQGYTQAAWWNRIPVEAWLLMLTIAIGCSVLIAFSAHRRDWRIYLIVPAAVSFSFLLIADIDSPRRGFIHISAQNLESVRQSLTGQ